MAQDSSDLFLLLKMNSGQMLAGETLDKTLKDRGMEITDFEFSFGRSSVRDPVDMGTAIETLKGVNDPKLKPVLDALEKLNARIVEKEKELKGKVIPDQKESTASFTFSVTKSVDRATPALMMAYNDSCLDATYLFKSAVMRSYRSGGARHPYFRASFGTVRIVSYKISMSSPLPKEEMDFAFSQCQLEYWPQDAQGQYGDGFKYAFDFMAKKPWTPKMMDFVFK